MKVYSSQSGQEILFATSTAGKVQTNPVKGDYTLSKALEELLKGTGLIASRDEASGTLSVTRDPNGQRAVQTPASDRPIQNPTSSATTASAANEEKTIELSPFEVTSDRDTGFAANSSLAGGRLATDLRDTPVAYSVMTREFIDALEITDLLEATSWGTNNTERLTIGNDNFFASTGEYSTRGFISSNGTTTGGDGKQRNFFSAFSLGDTYNLERIDFSRGPNAILFGNGSLGGMTSTTTKRARTERAFQTVKARINSDQGVRTELDVNQPLLGGKAAVRASLLWSDGEGWRDQDFDKRRGAFLSATFKPFKNTEIRLEGEYFRNARQKGRTDTNDLFSGWDGVTTYNKPAPLAKLPGNANALGISRNGTRYVYDPTGPANTIFNYQNDPITLGGGGSSTTPIAGFVQVGGSFNTSGATLIHAQNVPAGRFDTAIARSAFRPITEEFTTVPDGPEQIHFFRDLQMTMTHRVGDNLFFELAGDVNAVDLAINGGNNALSAVRIDINQVLPDGAPNPNFLQPYGEGTAQRNRWDFEFYGVRGAAAYVFPENRLGKFTVNLLGGTSSRLRNQDYRFLTLNEGADHRQWGFPGQQGVQIRRYFNAPSRPYPGAWGDSSAFPASINFVDPVNGISKTIQPRWTRDINRADTQQVDTSDFDYVLASLNAKFFKDRLVVLGAVRRDAYKFGARFTKNRGDYPLDWDGQTRIFRPEAPADYLDLTYQPLTAAGVPNGPISPAITRPRISATGDRDPKFLNDRFRDDFNPPVQSGTQVTSSIGTVLHLHRWFNPSFNYAETFNPPNGTPRINGLLRNPTVAEGTDYGLRMELFRNAEGRTLLDLNFNYYEAEEINAIDGTTLATGTINNLINANIIGDQSNTGTNIRGVPALPLVYRDSRNQVAQGVEVEVAYNPTKSFRLTGNYSQPKTGSSNRQNDTLAYISANAANFANILIDAGGLIDADNVASVDDSVPEDDKSPNVQAAVNAYNAIFDWQETWTGNVAQLDDNQARASLFADYQFQSGWLKGLRVGAGARYYGKVGLGNRANDTIRDPANPTKAIDDPAVDGTHVVYREAYSLVTGTLAYSWKWRDRDFQANLVVNNLLDDRDPIYFNSVLRPTDNDYTSPARQRVGNLFQLKQPINFQFSLTVKL